MTQHRQTGITIISVLMIIGGLILLFTGITPNFTLNANGLNVNVFPDSLSGLIAFHAQAEARDTDIGSSKFGTDEKKFGFDKDFVYTSLNNNNTQGTPTTTTPSAQPPPCEVTVDTITGLGNAPFGIAYDSVNERIYVTNSDDSTVSVINTTTNTVDPTPITVGSAPYGIAYDLVSDRMYVANSLDETVSVINLC
ncbi:MAG: YncE family protein [Nitrososphaeraceae archaeon]